MTFTLIEADCIEAMQAMAENSVDAIVTDPPYGLEFMGKEWDAFRLDDPGTSRNRGDRARHHDIGDAPTPKKGNPWASERQSYGGAARPRTSRCVTCGKRDQRKNVHEPCGAGEWRTELIDPHAAPPTMLAFGEWSRLWATEALRILKPGGHLLAFGGTRTYHRLACAIEDAGFEIRDCLAWMYGSGFPKSLDVSKAIDKQGRREYVKAAMDLGVPIPDNSLHDWIHAEHSPGEKWWARFKAVIPDHHWMRIEREVLQSRTRKATGRMAQGEGGFAFGEDFADTAPATPEAQRWNGWGTALKPAFEPIVLARKPLSERNVAANVQRWGVGAINVDACRVGGSEYDGSHDAEDNGSSDSRKGGPRAVHEDMPGVRSGVLHDQVTPQKDVQHPLSLGLDGGGAEPELHGGRLHREQDGLPAPQGGAEPVPPGTSGGHGGSAGASSAAIGTRPPRQRDQDGQPTGEPASAGNGRTREAPPQGAARASRTEGGEPDPTATAQGRWPANLILDPVAAAMLDEQTGELRNGGQNATSGDPMRSMFLDGRTRTAPTAFAGDTGGASRFFYCPKADREERNRGHGANLHPTVKPVELMRWLVRMVTPPKGTVLDPFTGSGSTGVAAMREGFEFIGIEREAEYVEIARARIIGDAPLFNVEADPPGVAAPDPG